MSLLDDKTKESLGIKLTNPFGDPAPSTDTSSLNQEYNSQVASGKFKGSFADFMSHLDLNKVLTSGSNLLQNVRSLFGKNTDPVDYTGSAPTGPDTPMNPWLKGALWVGGIGLGITIIVVIAKKMKK